MAKSQRGAITLSSVCEEILSYSIKTAPSENLIRLISILLQFGANPNPNNEAYAPLLSAIEIPDVSVIQLLVNSGANVNFTNEKVNRKRAAINLERK